jgi:hypothetical protein
MWRLDTARESFQLSYQLIMSPGGPAMSSASLKLATFASTLIAITKLQLPLWTSNQFGDHAALLSRFWASQMQASHWKLWQRCYKLVRNPVRNAIGAGSWWQIF